MWSVRVKDYWALTKPEVNTLVLMSTFCGLFLGDRGSLDPIRVFHTLLGTLLVASGTATLNQLMERAHDAGMRRTANRPLPAGRIRASRAFAFGILISVGGVVYLALAVNFLTSGLALFTLASYLLLYTPLKRKTFLCTLVGAFPGAMPPLIGFAAAGHGLGAQAWVLYGMLLLWQFPHFLAIAWMYREDYARAGFRMLPPGDSDGRFTAMEVLGFSFALLLLSLIPTLSGWAGRIYFLGALGSGLIFLLYGARLALTRSNMNARRLVHASVIYLPVVLGLMMWNNTLS